jgi:uncharacterized membrane protein AbrB (regulator of aidB expression)
MIKFIQGLFMDNPDSPSMKRLIALFLGILLGVTLYHNSFSEQHVAPSEALVYSVTLLIAALLGLKVVEKAIDGYFGKKNGTDGDNEETSN